MADEQAGTPPAAEQVQDAGQPENAAAQHDANGGAQPGAKTFSQADVDRMIADRLDRERKTSESKAQKAREESERKAAEQQGEFEKLYELAQAELETERNERKALELAKLRREVADKIGLPAGLVDRLRGETADDIEADAKELIKALPKPAAPNINATGGGNGASGGLPDDVMREKAIRYGVDPELFKQNYRSG